jgi:hypothetical protein
MTGGSGQQGTVSGTKRRPTDLAPENLELVAEHHQLDVLHIQATAAANEQAEQSPNSTVEEGADHAADPPKPSPEKPRHG